MNPSRLSLGAVFSGIAAGLCCLGPLVVTLIGVGSYGLFRYIEPLRPVFILLTAGFLGYAFFRLRRMAAEGCCPPETIRRQKWILGISALIALFGILFPYLAPWVQSALAAEQESAIPTAAQAAVRDADLEQAALPPTPAEGGSPVDPSALQSAGLVSKMASTVLPATGEECCAPTPTSPGTQDATAVAERTSAASSEP